MHKKLLAIKTRKRAGNIKIFINIWCLDDNNVCVF